MSSFRAVNIMPLGNKSISYCFTGPQSLLQIIILFWVSTPSTLKYVKNVRKTLV